jgi:heme exporter protein D
MTESERRRKEIMDDVMGELARLEQIDMEKKQQEN